MKYLLFTALAMTIHLSAAALLFVPLFDKMKSAKALFVIVLASIILLAHAVYPMKDDKRFLQIQHFCYLHKVLNLKNPKTYNEKMQWMKLYDRNPLYTKLVDKIEANVFGSFTMFIFWPFVLLPKVITGNNHNK